MTGPEPHDDEPPVAQGAASSSAPASPSPAPSPPASEQLLAEPGTRIRNKFDLAAQAVTMQSQRLDRLRGWWRRSRSHPQVADRPRTVDEQAPRAAGARASGATPPWQRTYLLPLLGGALAASIPALAALFTIAFEVFPWLEPPAPTDVRGVSITRLELIERGLDLDAGAFDEALADVFVYELAATGYEDEDLLIRWLLVDAATLQRVAAQDYNMGATDSIDLDTRNDRIVGEIPVLFPLEAAHDPGCVILRVYVQIAGGDEEDPLLDVADSPPYDLGESPTNQCAGPATGQETQGALPAWRQR